MGNKKEGGGRSGGDGNDALGRTAKLFIIVGGMERKEEEGEAGDEKDMKTFERGAEEPPVPSVPRPPFPSDTSFPASRPHPFQSAPALHHSHSPFLPSFPFHCNWPPFPPDCTGLCHRLSLFPPYLFSSFHFAPPISGWSALGEEGSGPAPSPSFLLFSRQPLSSPSFIPLSFFCLFRLLAFFSRFPLQPAGAPTKAKGWEWSPASRREPALQHQSSQLAAKREAKAIAKTAKIPSPLFPYSASLFPLHSFFTFPFPELPVGESALGQSFLLIILVIFLIGIASAIFVKRHRRRKEKSK